MNTDTLTGRCREIERGDGGERERDFDGLCREGGGRCRGESREREREM